MSNLKCLLAIAAISLVLSGCAANKPIIVATTLHPTLGVSLNATPLPTATLAAGEIVSAQDAGLVVSDIKIAPARIGRSVSGYITNRGTRDYNSVHLHLKFLDAHGKTVSDSSAFRQLLSPGQKEWFYINMPDESVTYKITDLSGD